MPCVRARWTEHVRRRFSSATIALVAILTVFAPSANAMTVSEDLVQATAGSRYGFNRTEKCLMRKINRARRSQGMRGLDWDRQIGYVARRHASSMAQQRAVWHDYALGQKITRWQSLGQNTGRGGRCGGMFRQFMRSNAHRSNILGRWRHVGVGTQRSGGRLYVQQVFESRYNPGNIYSYP